MGAQRGGSGAGTIDPSCDPTPCPSAPVHPAACLRQAAGTGKIRARYARFFFAPLCGATKNPTGKGPPRTSPGKGERAMSEVRLDTRQAPARAELLLAADFGREARGRPIHGRLESEDGGAGEPGPRLKLGAVRPRRLAVSEAADRPSGSLRQPATRHARERPNRPHRSAPGRVDRRPRRPRLARLPRGAQRGRHLRAVDRARPGPSGAGPHRAAGGRGGEPRGGVAPRRRAATRPRQPRSHRALARRPEDRAAERLPEAPVAGGTAAVAARPRAEGRPRMTPLTGTPPATAPSRPS